MSSDPYVQLYTSDFLGGTSGLTASTKGVYITLLCLMYETEAPLGQSWATLARRCGCTLPAFKKAMQDLEDDGKITVSDDGLWSEKCDKHIAHRRERRSSAKAAAEKRWEKTKQNQDTPDANAMRKGCQPEPEPEKKEETNVSSQKKRGTRLPDDWVLPLDWGKWAVSEGWPETTVREEADKFRDFWISKAGAAATKVDWQATWRNWMRNSKSPRLVAGGAQPRGTTNGATIAQRAAARFARLDLGEGDDPSEPLLPAIGWRGSAGGGAG